MNAMTEIKAKDAEIVQLRHPDEEPNSTPVPGATPSPSDTMQDAPALAKRRKRGFRILALLLLVSGLGWWGWQTFLSGNVISTDNAYVAGDVATITPSINGSVSEVRVSETQFVKAGDVLIVLDGSDAHATIAEAQAQERQAARRISGLIQSDAGFHAQVNSRMADQQAAQAKVAEARAGLAKAEQDLRRRGAVLGIGAISGEEFSAARASRDTSRASLSTALAQVAAAGANVRAARSEMAANHELVAGSSIHGNPEVAAASARVRLARNELSRTVIRAPFDGVVARKQVQIGQRVQAGAALMTIVPMDKLYVMANFKEDQIREMAVGQPVNLTSDRYGSKVTFFGHVHGFAAGTGSAFAAIPAQNATGNWIKTVQRVPVRIALDEAQLKAHPLLIGLSMTARVDLGK